MLLLSNIRTARMGIHANGRNHVHDHTSRTGLLNIITVIVRLFLKGVCENAY